MTNKIVVCKPLLSRQSIILPDLVIELNIDDINIGIFPEMKNQIYEYIVLNSKPTTIFMFNINDNQRGLYGHSSFPQINNTKYYQELHFSDINNNNNNNINNNNNNSNNNNIKTVKYAGRLRFNSLGELESWNNSSGHFKPSANNAPSVGLDMNKFKNYKVFTWAQIVSGRKY